MALLKEASTHAVIVAHCYTLSKSVRKSDMLNFEGPAVLDTINRKSMSCFAFCPKFAEEVRFQQPSCLATPSKTQQCPVLSSWKVAHMWQ